MEASQTRVMPSLAERDTKAFETARILAIAEIHRLYEEAKEEHGAAHETVSRLRLLPLFMALCDGPMRYIFAAGIAYVRDKNVREALLLTEARGEANDGS